MKQIKVSEATPIQLDRLVAKCVGWLWRKCCGEHPIENYSPSTNWAQGGPLIEKERIGLEFMDNFEAWSSSIVREDGQDRESYSDDQDRESYTVEQESFVGYGPTPLIAAMRVFVASRLGNEVDVPEELAALVKGE